LLNGRPWWFDGYNSNSGLCGGDDEILSDAEINAWYDSMRHDGHGLSRVWVLPSDGDVGLAKLRDVVLPAAERNNVFLVVTLDDAGNACGRQRSGDYYSSGWRTDGFGDHLRRMLPALKDRTHIAMWEPINEPDRGNGNMMKQYFDAVGSLMKSLDPNHLISSGFQVPYDGSEANVAIAQSSKYVDIASFHEYDTNDAESPWFPAAQRASGGKPMYMGEFGISGAPVGSGCLSYGDRAAWTSRKLHAYFTHPEFIGGTWWVATGDTPAGCDLKTGPQDQPMVQMMRASGP